MSMDPAHTLPPEYDDALPSDYDPAFTADISTKMRVPDVIGVKGETRDVHLLNGLAEELLHDKARTSNMHVPEKIIYQGNNESQGMRKDISLHLDMDLENKLAQAISLHTPPRHLTIEEAFNTDAVNDDLEKSLEYDSLHEPAAAAQLQHPPNGMITPSPQHTRDNSYLPLDTSLSTPPLPADAMLVTSHSGGAGDMAHASRQQQLMAAAGGSGDDMLAVKQHLHRLSRRVLYLEQLHERTALRDRVFYPVVMGYLLFQFLKWCTKT